MSPRHGDWAVRFQSAANPLKVGFRVWIGNGTPVHCARVLEKEVMSQPQEWLAAAIEASHIGGRILLDWQGKFSVREKSRANLVTEADEASQAAIVDSLRSRFPDHGFLGEENLNDRSSQQAPFWIIDPLDGTSNYVHRFPYFAVSIGLMVDGQMEAGVIFDPTRGETFAAVRGAGATLNGKKVATSGETEPSKAFAMASLPVAATPENPAVRRFLNSLNHLQTVQRTGSAALNLAYVASGRVDAFWSSSLHPWDMAAGVLLVTEAGGSLSNLTGGAFDLFVPSLLAASTASLRKELVPVLA